MLEVDALSVGYSGKRVLHQVSISVAEGAVVALVGHNGAGKTTLLRAALGLVPRLSGTVVFRGEPVQVGAAAATIRRGLSFVPQGRNTFRDMSVAENLAIAASAAARDTRVDRNAVFDLFPILHERLTQRAGSLSGGQQQMLALACVLLRGPRMILLDEPSTGLAPVLVDGVFKTVAELRRRYGVSLLVVDQNVRRLLAIADRLYVLKAGEIVFAGAPAEIGADSDLWRLF